MFRNFYNFGCFGQNAKKGLVERFVNKEDRREIRVVVTEKGKALQEPIQQIIETVNEVVLRDFSEEEVQRLKENLKIIASGKFTN